MTRVATVRWTEVSELVAVLRRRWDTGMYLRSYGCREAFEPIVLPVRAPSAEELLYRFEEVRSWATAFEARAAPFFEIEHRVLGGRSVGTNRVPARVRVPSFDRLCQILDTAADVVVLDDLLSRTTRIVPQLEAWACQHPRVVLEHRQVWDRVLATISWIADNDTRHLYLRHLDAEGVDTKFVERKHRLLTELLLVVLPAERVTPDSVDFARRFQFLGKPVLTRLRFLDTTVSPCPPGVSEVSLRTDQLAVLALMPRIAFVVENEISYLALPPVSGAIAIFGSGFASAGLAVVPWLRDIEVVYWGDIDTYGFDILDRLRGHLPDLRSILMDRETLLFHRVHWSTEDRPTCRPLPHLTDAEQSLYQDLTNDIFGVGVRLEQERVRFFKLRHALSPWIARRGAVSS